MEGVLHKWTNYMSGWQPRWFVLNDDGILSYYNSRDETRNGCRGSVNLALCEIVVHQNDPRRLDIVIPGEQHYSLKAPTANDRSSWLRVLGSTKLVGKRRNKESELSDAIRTRRSEVRLYLDLLLQQVAEAQTAARDDDKTAAQNSLGMVVTTAQVLARSVDDVLLLTSSFNLVSGPSEAHLVVSPNSTPMPPKSLEVLPSNDADLNNGNNSQVSYFNPQLGLLHCKAPETPNPNGVNGESNGFAVETPTLNDATNIRAQDSSSNLMDELTVHQAVPNSQKPLVISETPVTAAKPAVPAEEAKKSLRSIYKYRSSISELEHTFADVELTATGDMSVVEFLDAARGILVILDRFQTSVLSPVRSDVAGNITKIETGLTRLKRDASQFTIQALISVEMDAGRATTDPSAGVGLVWLVRGLGFVSMFLKLLADPECTDARQCASEAYTKTLRSFHGLMARTIFSVALQALPAKPSQFLISIGGEKADIADIRQDLSHYVSGLREVLDALNKFLDKVGLSKKL